MSRTRESQEKWLLQSCDPPVPLALSLVSFLSSHADLWASKMSFCIFCFFLFSKVGYEQKLSLIPPLCLKMVHIFSISSSFTFKRVLRQRFVFPSTSHWQKMKSEPPMVRQSILILIIPFMVMTIRSPRDTFWCFGSYLSFHEVEGDKNLRKISLIIPLILYNYHVNVIMYKLITYSA